MKGLIVYIEDENYTLFFTEEKIYVNAPEEGSEELDHMWGQVCETSEDLGVMSLAEFNTAYPQLAK